MELFWRMRNAYFFNPLLIPLFPKFAFLKLYDKNHFPRWGYKRI